MSLLPSHRKPPGQAHGHRRHDTNVVQLAAVAPERPRPPAGLLTSSRRRWDAYWSSAAAHAVDPASDLGRLNRWILQLDEYERVRRVITTGRGTRLVNGSTGQPVLNPLIPYMAQLEAQIAKAEDHFGMTPMSRLRLGITAAAGAIAAGRARAAAAAQAAQAANEGDEDRRARVLGRIGLPGGPDPGSMDPRS